MLASGRSWAGITRALAGFKVTAPDLLGHGRAPDPDPNADFHDQATAAAAARLSGGPGILVGHSLGATIALRLAIEMPQRVARLILIEPVLFAGAGDGPGRAATRAQLGHLEGLPAEAAARRFLAVWGDKPYEALKPAQQAYICERIWLEQAQAPTLEEDRANLLPRLGRVDVPVLLIEGAKSPPVIAEIMTRLEADLADTSRVVIAGAGHMAPITHAGEVARAIKTFLGCGAVAEDSF